MHREIQIKQFPIVTTHWWPKTRNERFVWENEQYLYRLLPLVHNHVQVIWVHTHPVCDVCVTFVWRVCVTCVCVCVTCVCDVCARALARRRQRLTEGVPEAWCWRNFSSANGAISQSDRLMQIPNPVHATPEKYVIGCCNYDGASAPRFRHALRQALTPTPRVNAAWARARAHTSHTGCVCTQITWTWLCTRGKKRYKYCSFSHTKPLVSCLRHQCVVTMGNCLIWISLCMFFFPLIETVTYTCHYMTDRLERFDLKTSKLDSTEEKKTPTSWMPLG